jgi:hypothetical protein
VIELPKFYKPPETGGTAPWFQVAVALSMVLSAGASLVAALRTSATMTALVDQNARLVRAGSTPILQFGSSNVNDKGEAEIILNVENAGTGPARVVWMEIRHKGQVLKSARDLLKIQAAELGLDSIGSTYTMTGSIGGDVLVAGRSRALFRWQQPADPASRRLWEAVNNSSRALEAEACFCSVFDECKLTHFNGELPQSVASCAAQDRISINGGS